MVDNVVNIFDEGFEELYDQSLADYEAATSFTNIGKVHFDTILKVYSNGVMNEVDVKTWKAANPVEGFKLIELVVNVDVKEFRPDSQYDYTRRITVNGRPWNRKVNGEWVSTPSDWFTTWEPSVKKVTGITDMKEALKYLEGKYVKVADVEQQPTKSSTESGKKYNTAKLLAVYESREAAYNDFNGDSNGATKTASTPTKSDGYTKDIVDGVKTLKATGMDNAKIATSLGLTVNDVETILS